MKVQPSRSWLLLFALAIILLMGALILLAPRPQPSQPRDFQVQVVAEGLVVPWALAFTPDGRLFFTQREGSIWVIDELKAPSAPREVLRLKVAAVGEAGLLGLAVDPNYPSSPYLYAYYTYADGRGRLWNRVVRLVDEGPRLKEEKVLIDGIPGAPLHDGGRIRFGPDGKLYITTGDATNPRLSQDLNSLAGKILRIKPDGSIPRDNPFPNSPIYSWGHRNPQGIDWDPSSGLLYSTEHGAIGNDEVNLIMAGANYGWPIVEGKAGDPRYKDPIALYNPAVAPSGASFYDGELFPQWRGAFFFATLRGQHLHILFIQGEEIKGEVRLFQGTYGRIRDVAVGPDGFIYFSTSNRDGRGRPSLNDDRILRIVPIDFAN